MDFESAVQYLKSHVSYEDVRNFKYDQQHFNLKRVKDFLEVYCDGYKRLKYVHVAGSKGKGSVCYLVANYLKEVCDDGGGVGGSGSSSSSGVSGGVGLFTSPYLTDITEPFWVNGELISREEFVDYVEDLRDFLEKNPQFKLTYFELLFALVLLYFVKKGVEYAVLEVGLGGRLDATNVVEPQVCALTTVEKEHTDVLGNSYEEILREKMGIYKKGVPFVIGEQDDEVSEIITRDFAYGELVFVEERIDFSEDLPLINQKNASLAFYILEKLLGAVNFDIFAEIAVNLRILGRFDLREIDGKDVVFDMAHTKKSIESLIENLKCKFKGRKFVFLLSFMKDKDIEGILKVIEPVVEKIVLTSAHKERGYLPDNSLGVEFIEDPRAAFEDLLEQTDKKREVLVVTGSHFLLKELKI